MSENGDDSSELHLFASQNQEWVELIESVTTVRYRCKVPGSLREGHCVQVQSKPGALHPVTGLPCAVRPYLVLTRTSLQLFKSRFDSKAATTIALTPSTTISSPPDSDIESSTSNLNNMGLPTPFIFSIRPEGTSSSKSKKSKSDDSLTFACESREQRELWLYFLKQACLGPESLEAALKKLISTPIDLFETILTQVAFIYEYRRWALSQVDNTSSLLLAHQAIMAFKTATNEEEANILAFRAIFIYEAFLIPTATHYLEFKTNGAVIEKFSEKTPQDLQGKFAMRGSEFDTFLREVQRGLAMGFGHFKQSEQYLNCAILQLMYARDDGVDEEQEIATEDAVPSGPRPPAPSSPKPAPGPSKPAANMATLAAGRAKSSEKQSLKAGSKVEENGKPGTPKVAKAASDAESDEAEPKINPDPGFKPPPKLLGKPVTVPISAEVGETDGEMSEDQQKKSPAVLKPPPRRKKDSDDDESEETPTQPVFKPPPKPLAKKSTTASPQNDAQDLQEAKPKPAQKIGAAAQQLVASAALKAASGKKPAGDSAKKAPATTSKPIAKESSDEVDEGRTATKRGVKVVKKVIKPGEAQAALKSKPAAKIEAVEKQPVSAPDSKRTASLVSSDDEFLPVDMPDAAGDIEPGAPDPVKPQGPKLLPPPKKPENKPAAAAKTALMPAKVIEAESSDFSEEPPEISDSD